MSEPVLNSYPEASAEERARLDSILRGDGVRRTIQFEGPSARTREADHTPNSAVKDYEDAFSRNLAANRRELRASEPGKALFLDFEVAGHRVIVFPAWLEASLVGHPVPLDQLPPEILASIPELDTLPPLYKTDTLSEDAQQRIVQQFAAVLARLA